METEFAAAVVHAALPHVEATAGPKTTPDGVAFPLVLSHLPQPHDFSPRDWVVANKAEIFRLLARHGCILFRGFPLPDAASFGSFVGGFEELADLPYEDSLSLAVRAPVCPRVCTTNEGRSGGLVWHHEQAAAPRYPSKVFFYCEVPAASGGGTGVSPSWPVYEALAAAHPAFLADCLTKGVTYRLSLPSEADTGTGVGRSWKSFFGVESRAAAEARMAELGYTAVWDESVPGLVHLTTPVLPAVWESCGGAGRTLLLEGTGDIRALLAPAPGTRRSFFNQLAAQVLGNAAEFEKQRAAVDASVAGAAPPSPPPRYVCFGDGSPLPDEPLRTALAAADAGSVDVEWRQGDVVLLDNMTVMHARRPWAGDGPRRVLASLAVDMLG